MIFIYTPEHKYTDSQKGSFFAQTGNQQHQIIQQWEADLRKQIQEFHRNLQTPHNTDIISQFSHDRKVKYKKVAGRVTTPRRPSQY